MRAWRPNPSGALAALEVPLPEPTGDRALVQIEAAALGAPELAAGNLPLTPGGAAVGTVVATGDEASHVLGRRVLVGPRAPCGECDRCRRGAAAVCARGAMLGRDTDGTLATHVVASARWLCPLEEGLALPGPAAAAAARELVDAYALYARTGVAPGEPVIIAGASVVDRFLVEIALAMGTRPIALADQDQEEWRRFVESRALTVVDATADELLARTRAAAAGAGLGERPWRVFDGEGTHRSRARALTLAEPAATITLLASVQPDQAEVSLEALVARGCTVIGVAGAHPDLMSEAAALAATGEVGLAEAVTVIDVTALEERFLEFRNAPIAPRLTVVAIA
jgi:D-arabinose 1-dehydrogenase-like Zn-dependent alcohol dehydrogenase